MRSNHNSIDRIIDANLNRAREGLRVCEEVVRFAIGSRELAAMTKRSRHKLSVLSAAFYEKRGGRLSSSGQDVRYSRDTLSDPGRTMRHPNEMQRRGCVDIFFANIQRVKESLRVLEEFSKVDNARLARRFITLRFEAYDIEKRVAQAIEAIRDRRPRNSR